MTQGVKQIIVSKIASDPASSEKRNSSKEGLQEGVSGEVSARQAEGGKAEANASSSAELASDAASSPELASHPVSSESSPEVPEDPRLAAMRRWGIAAQAGAQIGEVVTNPSAKKKRWARPAIIADEPRDFDEFPLKETDVA